MGLLKRLGVFLAPDGSGGGGEVAEDASPAPDASPESLVMQVLNSINAGDSSESDETAPDSPPPTAAPSPDPTAGASLDITGIRDALGVDDGDMGALVEAIESLKTSASQSQGYRDQAAASQQLVTQFQEMLKHPGALAAMAERSASGKAPLPQDSSPRGGLPEKFELPTEIADDPVAQTLAKHINSQNTHIANLQTRLDNLGGNVDGVTKKLGAQEIANEISGAMTQWGFSKDAQLPLHLMLLGADRAGKDDPSWSAFGTHEAASLLSKLIPTAPAITKDMLVEKFPAVVEELKQEFLREKAAAAKESALNGVGAGAKPAVTAPKKKSRVADLEGQDRLVGEVFNGAIDTLIQRKSQQAL
jgi:hypothetical protein